MSMPSRAGAVRSCAPNRNVRPKVLRSFSTTNPSMLNNANWWMARPAWRSTSPTPFHAIFSSTLIQRGAMSWRPCGANMETSRQIDVLRTDAAAGIAWVVSKPISKASHRGVAFLDPFGAKLNWSSVQQLADTGLFEVVVNFGLNMAIQRMLPNSGEVPDGWAKTLDAYFGTRASFDEVYHERGGGLFGTSELKHPDYSERLLELYRARLKSAFGHVSTPRLIRNTKGVPLYYLLWAGPHPKGLKGADYILKMGERLCVRGGRRKSA